MKIQHSFKGNATYCEQCNATRKKHRGKRKPRNNSVIYIGIDGEGVTEHFGPWPGKHRYTMLCAADENGHQWMIENPLGLKTKQCLDFIVSLPAKTGYRVFSYSFGYDLTKILEDIDDLTLYRLVRPELRRRLHGKIKISAPVYWPPVKPQFCLNWLNGQFSVKKLEGTQTVIDPKTGGPTVGYKWGPPVIIHDIWRFFQGKFTTALEDWKVPDNVSPSDRKHILERMRAMKDKRSNFDQLNGDDIRAYCFEECQFMATLARKLTEAHTKAGIPLKRYFGAGSSAEAMMLVMGVKGQVKQARGDNPIPDSVEYAQRCAFFGGRFENSRIGAIQGNINCEDISSAYPYQLTKVPCLIHGHWEHTTERNRISHARTALVRYTLTRPNEKLRWGPFPFRLSNGSIAFPESSGGGWIWREEYLAGEKLFDNVCFQEAWLYHCDCDCQPFKDVSRYYALRLKIGKEGPGIAVKLGMNSIYGKTAQTIGGEPGAFQSWMWAGLITSGCRAQVLEVMSLHRDLDNLLMVATDGIATLETLTLPKPTNTNTNWLPCPTPNPKDIAESPQIYHCENGQWSVNKPLGGWERKVLTEGLFLARPGIYFPLNPTENDIKRIRARGLGRAAVWDNWKKIVETYERGEPGIEIENLSLFRGIKTSITRSHSDTPGKFNYNRSEQYGRWITRSTNMTFSPLPKREAKIGNGGRLTLRRLDELESGPYNKEIISTDAMAMLLQGIEDSEQPDGGDLTEYGNIDT
jgi:hypothetical protein